jgi:hypothetical protein
MLVYNSHQIGECREVRKMATIQISDGAHIDLGAMETLVKQGKTVISAEDSAIVQLAMKTFEEGKTATFYLKPIVYTEIMKRYWTPERVKSFGLQPIPTEQVDRIKSDFNIEIDGYANNVNCPRCGNVYSTYEFIQQGIREHGEEAVRAVFSLKEVGIVRVHPVQNSICARCRLPIVMASGGTDYSYEYHCRAGNGYGCCQKVVAEPQSISWGTCGPGGRYGRTGSMRRSWCSSPRPLPKRRTSRERQHRWNERYGATIGCDDAQRFLFAR